METIHEGDIYQGFPLGEWPLDLQGWGFESPIFEAVIKNIKPKLIIEVGSWKGASALQMAKFLKQEGINGEIICVDSWLGTADTWWHRDDISFGRARQFGRPTVYHQFIANIIHTENTDVIIPLPSDSLSAAQFLKAKGVQADMIYIDAGHDYTHCLQDIKAYWGALRLGGVMIGDDYSLAWPGVVRAVHEFAESTGRIVGTNFPSKWVMVK